MSQKHSQEPEIGLLIYPDRFMWPTARDDGNMHCDAFLRNHQPFIADVESNDRWCRIVCLWKEPGPEGTVRTHLFFPLLDKSNGDVYSDDGKGMIYAKFACQLFLQPIDLLIKILYHLVFPISLPHIIYKTTHPTTRRDLESWIGMSTKRQIGVCLKKSLESILDIVRTPMFGIAMIIVAVAALLIGPWAPKFLYDCRKAYGKLLQRLYRTHRWYETSGNCMQNFWTLERFSLEEACKRAVTFHRQMPFFTRLLNPFASHLDEEGTYVSPSFLALAHRQETLLNFLS